MPMMRKKISEEPVLGENPEQDGATDAGQANSEI